MVNFHFLKSPKIWAVVIVIALVIALRMTVLGELLSFDTLRAHRIALVAWVEANRLLASAAYVLSYVLVVAFSFPGAVVLTLSGGFLFGAALGTFLTAIGATIGATFVFIFAKYLVGDRVFDRLGTQYPDIINGLHENAWSYLLVLRFVPLFPFFLINLAAAFVGVKPSTYVATTFFGILPGTTVYSLAGAGLGTVLDRDEVLSVSSILTPTVLFALVGLAFLSLAAIPIRNRLRKPK